MNQQIKALQNNAIIKATIFYSGTSKKEEKPKLSRPERIYMAVLSNLKKGK
jgi:hypothetical protein